jgi:hypothetical protein
MLLFTNISHSKPILVITILFLNVFVDAIIDICKYFGVFGENIVI